MTCEVLPTLTITVPEVRNKAARPSPDPLGIVVNGQWWLILMPTRDCKTSCKREKVQRVSLLFALLTLLKALILLLCDDASREGWGRAEHPPGEWQGSLEASVFRAVLLC